MSLERPKVGDAVIVRWVDSGLAALDLPADAPPLVVNKTHGEVVSLRSDRRLRCGDLDQETLTLAMCSAGKGDIKSELAVIWWPSVIEVTVVGPRRRGSGGRKGR